MVCSHLKRRCCTSIFVRWKLLDYCDSKQYSVRVFCFCFCLFVFLHRKVWNYIYTKELTIIASGQLELHLTCILFLPICIFFFTFSIINIVYFIIKANRFQIKKNQPVVWDFLSWVSEMAKEHELWRQVCQEDGAQEGTSKRGSQMSQGALIFS